MNKKLQAKDAEKKSATVQRAASYRLALRRSAPPEAEDLLTKGNENSPQLNQTVITSQPTKEEEKKVSIDESTDPKTELMADHKTNGENGIKSNGFMEEKGSKGENDCTKFCCDKLCCHYCKCCPNCCLLQMRRLESLLIHMTDCGLNCLRVFT